MERPHDELYRAPPNLYRMWRMLIEALWRIEHEFERSRNRNRAVDDTRVRIFGVLMLFALIFSALAVKAGAVALLHRVEVGTEGPVAVIHRADVVDRQGEVLALDVPYYGLYLDGRDVWSAKETRDGIATVLPRAQLSKIDEAVAGKRVVLLQNGLTAEQRDRVHDLGLPGVTFQEEPRRAYPLEHQGSHLIGFADPGGKGLAGAEKALDGDIHAAAAAGGHITLAMDLRIQAALEGELKRALDMYGAENAIGVVTNVQTGEVLALANLPDYDPNHPGEAGLAAQNNQAAAAVHEMGSTFKMFTFAMVLNEHVARLDTVMDTLHPLQIGPRTVHDSHPAGKNLTVEEVFLESSNIGTGRLVRMAGIERLQTYLQNLGLLDRARIELSESARPQRPAVWNEDSGISVSFGHALSVTPLAVAQGVGPLVNGGRLLPLTIRRREAGQTPPGTQVISPETSRTLLQLLRKNVTDGTGRNAEKEAPGYRMGGKTGTAEKVIKGKYARKRLFTSFAGVFPTDGPLDAPRYLVLVLLDEPKPTAASSGNAQAAWNAGPTAGRVINRIAPLLNVKRDLTQVVAHAVDKPVVDDVSTVEQ
jgi:cell division protein FtsI (penicillin-binding protein 3)